MEDGSIFVCFLCEKEFRKISDLNEHMTQHGTLPEMSEELPPRKKKKKQAPALVSSESNEKESNDINAIKETTTKPKTDAIVASPKPNLHKHVKPKLEPPVTPVKVKPDPDAEEFSLAMKRAMKIKRYIERKESHAKEMAMDEEGLEDEEEENGLGGAQESIMMVDSSFFNSKVSQPPIGPTIMNAEPDGFMETTFEANQSKDTNGFQQEPEREIFIRNEIANIRGRGRGRGRGKRGRPAKIKDEDSYEYYIEARPGRRSRPRNEEEEQSERLYQCLECYKAFRTLSTMKVHMKSHGEDREIPCPYCDEVFPQRYILYEHLVRDHEESSSLTCPVCNKIFTRPDSLKSHMVRMHEENGGLNCYVCGKSFPSQGQLEMHVRVHTGERPFKCDLCGKGFVQKVHLRTHLRTMHNMTEANTTPCRICEEKFDGRNALREHYTAAHGLSAPQYKNLVAKLRKEGKIPEILPPKVNVVDPSFRYQKVAVTEMSELKQIKENQLKEKEAKPTNTSVYLTRRPGKKLKVRTRSERAEGRRPGMGTVMNMVSEEVMFSPLQFDIDADQPRARDQEELSIVESAFKVAEEMDQLRDGTTAALLMTDDSSSSGIYYSLPLDMAQDGDEEYAQFAAEHAHIEGAEAFAEEDREIAGPLSQPQGSRPSRSIIKAEPLEIYSDSMEAAQAVEMLTM